ncbi:GDP-L-fucose synthase [Rhizobium sp. Leaf262]|uniref:GDP-L-fucose synthase family protein n=1 Tax=Rhizobium sp. Leaf262 TaxID=1736312 RepID=UPI0007158FF2|nr:GDP-L-fucose synthase [Rhizobium sp. Leaf262]KQO79769.1 GDP-fucose synthetase [Rhizobium sp. Leaf262]
MFNKHSRIYIAGHTGLIGSAFDRVLSERGYTSLLKRTHSDLELTDSIEVDRFFEETKPEYVILTAGKVGGIHQNQATPATFIDTNLSIQLNVLKAAHRAGVERLVLFGSSCMYPRDCPQPMAETALLTGHPEPTSLAYAISKLAGVQLCHAYNKQYESKRFIPVIPNSAYGPNDNFDSGVGHVLSALMARMHHAKKDGLDKVVLWGTGSAKREFIHADDIAKAVLHLLVMPELNIDFPVNIGSGTDYEIRELAAAIAQTVGYKGALEWDTTKPDGAPRKLLDSGRLRDTGWAPDVEFKDGLADTYKWFLTNGLGREG